MKKLNVISIFKNKYIAIKNQNLIQIIPTLEKTYRPNWSPGFISITNLVHIITDSLLNFNSGNNLAILVRNLCKIWNLNTQKFKKMYDLNLLYNLNSYSFFFKTH